MSLEFKTEEDRINAISDLDPSLPDYDSRFSELEHATIGGVESQGANGDTAQGATGDTAQSDDMAAASTSSGEQTAVGASASKTGTDDSTTDVVEEIFTLKKSDLPGNYSSPQEVLKSFQNKEELIQRQQKKIEELLRQGQASVTQSSQQAQVVQQVTPQKQQQQQQLNTSVDFNAKLSRIDALETELDKALSDDEDAIHTTEFRRKERELSKLQKEVNRELVAQLTNVNKAAVDAKNATTEYIETHRSERERKEREEATRAYFKEVEDTVSAIPEYKLSKPLKDVDAEYREYRSKVALAYFGRPAVNEDEEVLAMDNAMRKNPVLLSSMQLIGLPSELPADLKNYLEICKIANFIGDTEKGAIDPITNQRCAALTKYDPVAKKHLPLSFKEGVEAYRVRTGYYANQVDSAYQRGAEQAANASMRRDKGAVELSGSEQRSSQEGSEWALGVIQKFNLEQSLKLADSGDNSKIDEYNRACKILDLPEI